MGTTLKEKIAIVLVFLLLIVATVFVDAHHAAVMAV